MQLVDIIGGLVTTPLIIGVGDPALVVNAELTDTVGLGNVTPEYCGSRTYQNLSAYSWLSLDVTSGALTIETF